MTAWLPFWKNGKNKEWLNNKKTHLIKNPNPNTTIGIWIFLFEIFCFKLPSIIKN